MKTVMVQRMGRWAAVLALCGAVASAHAVQDSVVKFKSGPVALTVMDANGVQPLQNTEVKLQAVENGQDLARSQSDTAGKASLSMPSGRYLLNVAGRQLCVVEFADDATLTACRVVVPNRARLVGGAEEKKDDTGGMVPILIGGGVVLVGGVVAAAVISHNRGGNDNTPTPAPTPKPTPPPAPKPQPRPEPISRR